MEDNKEYYAFISYKREDEKWAKWLQHKLEHYKLPSNLNGRTDLPREIRPVFRDVSDLAPGLLAEEIDNALLSSQWLIIICSPRSAKSPWVCKEAQTFINLGRADHIIPFVIEGNPFSNNIETECYPEALLNLTGSKELLAANINEMGRDAAAIKVVARMFGLRFDSLWQRYGRQKRKTRVMAFVAAVVIIALAIIVALIFRQQKRQLQLSQSRFITEKAEELIEQGDSYLAQLLLLEVLPDGSFADRPYSTEAELALRKALDIKTYRLPCSDIGGHGLRLSPNDKYIVGHSRSDTVYVWKICNGEIVNKFFIPNIFERYYLRLSDAEDLYSEKYCFFDSDSIICVIDSMMHFWNILTGENFKNEPIVNHTNHVFNTFGSGKVISVEVSERTKVWDFDSETKQYLMKGLDGCPLIANSRKKPIKTIPIKNTLAAAYMPNHDEIFVITNNYFLVWSIPQESMILQNEYRFDAGTDDDGFEGGDITIQNYEFDKSMRKVVINGYDLNGDVWILADIIDPDNYCISRKPILISTAGNIVVVNHGERDEDMNYYVEFDNNNRKSDTCDRIDYPYLYLEEDWFGEKMTIFVLSELNGPNMEGEYVVKVNNDYLYIDASTFERVYRKKYFDGELICFSSDKHYCVTRENNSLKIYKKNDRIRTIDLEKFPTLVNAEIGSSGKYLLTNHIDEDGNLHYVWDVDNNKVIYVIRDIVTKWIFSSDEERLFSSGGEVINLKDFSRAKLQQDNFYNDNENIYMTPNGRYVIIWNEIEIAAWDVLNYQQIWKKSAGNAKYPICDIKSDNNGELLLVTTRRDVQLFDLKSGSFYKLIGDNLSGLCLESHFSPDGSSVFIITVCGVYKYDIIPSDKLIYEAKKNLSGRKLTKEERKKYHLE